MLCISNLLENLNLWMMNARFTLKYSLKTAKDRIKYDLKSNLPQGVIRLCNRQTLCDVTIQQFLHIILNTFDMLTVVLN